MTTAHIIHTEIISRRDELTKSAKNIIEKWFEDEKSHRHMRNYGPMIRTKMTESGGISISIYWNQRELINKGRGNFTQQGKNGSRKLIKVKATYIPPRRKGPPYPRAAFPRASLDEWQKIEETEESLSIIRKEIKVLGRLLLANYAYARQFSPINDEDDLCDYDFYADHDCEYLDIL